MDLIELTTLINLFGIQSEGIGTDDADANHKYNHFLVGTVKSVSSTGWSVKNNEQRPFVCTERTEETV